MSLKRTIASMKRDLDNTPSWIQDKIDDLDSWWRRTWVHTQYYNVNNFIRNLKMFLPMAWNWRCWDSHYSIEAFCKMLEAQAKMIGENDSFVGSKKASRRCYAGAGYLRKAYNHDVDRTRMYLFLKNPFKFRKVPNSNMSEMIHDENTSKKIYDALMKLSSDRQDKEEKELKKHAWEYMHKHIESWWD